LALGHLARSGYTGVVTTATIVGFNLIKFVLIEVPLASYANRPERTAREVERFAAWMQAHTFEVVAGVVGIISLVLIGKGLVGLA
jgi:hypothetical protein